MNENELLQYAIKKGIINICAVRQVIEMEERQIYLEQHKNKIWQGKNGKWYTELPTDTGRKLVKRNTQEAVEDVIVAHYKTIGTGPTVKKVFEEWINQKDRWAEISQATIDRYKGEFARFISGTELEEKHIETVDSQFLEDFVKKRIIEMKLTAKAYGNMKTVLIGTFKFAKAKQYTTLSISEFFGDLELGRKIFQKREKKTQVFKESEVQKLILYLKSNPTVQNYGIILAFQTGVREGELAALKFSDLEEDKLRIQRQEVRYKGDKKMVHKIVDFTKTDAGDREIILTASAIETINKIRELNPDNEFMFMDAGRKVHKASFNDWLYKACRAIQIEPRSMHKIRKTYGTMLLDSGADDSLIMAQMGHADITTTRQFYYYSNKDDEKKKEQIRKAITI